MLHCPRKYYNQVKEIKIKLLMYNINKKVIERICIKLAISTEPEFQQLKGQSYLKILKNHLKVNKSH
jgi:hypothetical protein